MMTATSVQPVFLFFVCKDTKILLKNQGEKQIVNANSPFFDVNQCTNYVNLFGV